MNQYKEVLIIEEVQIKNYKLRRSEQMKLIVIYIYLIIIIRKLKIKIKNKNLKITNNKINIFPNKYKLKMNNR